jgi:hypothetical protein
VESNKNGDTSSPTSNKEALVERVEVDSDKLITGKPMAPHVERIYVP